MTQTIEELQKRNGQLEFQNHQLHEYLKNFTKFYYDMLEASLAHSSLIDFDPKEMQQYYRITESQYKTFKDWSRLVRKFNETTSKIE